MGLCDYFPLNYICPFGKTTLSVFTFCITRTPGSLLDEVIKHPYLYGICGALIVGGTLFLLIPTLVGFGPLGPIAGSWAAAWQSSIGNVVAGSLFATIQSLTMTGVFNSVGAAMIALGGLGAAAGCIMQYAGAGQEEYGGKMYERNEYTGKEIGGGAGGAWEIMARAADFAAEFARHHASADAAEIVARAADFAAASELATGAVGVIAGPAELAARYGVHYFPLSAADILARATNLAGSSASVVGMAARFGQIAGQYGFRMV